MDALISALGGATGYRQHQQQQQNSPHQHQVASSDSKSKRKIEIPRDKLTDYEFDRIVVETSASLARKSAEWPSYLATSIGEVKVDVQRASLHPGPPSPPSQLDQPKRPMNAFMVWGQAIRRELHNRFSNVQNALLSKALGRVWKRLDLVEKEPYICKANIIKTNHKRDYPDYRYQPRRIQEKQRRIQKQQQHQQQQQQKQRPVTNTRLPRKLAPPTPVKVVPPFSSSPPPLTPNRQQLYKNQHQDNQQPIHTYQSIAPRSPKATHSSHGNLGGVVGLTNNYHDNVSRTIIYGRGNNSIYKTSSHQYMMDALQLNNNNNVISSTGLESCLPVGAATNPLPESMNEADSCYSIYDETSSHCHSSEASSDIQSYVSKNLDRGPVYSNNNDNHQHARTLFLDSQQVNYDRDQQTIYSPEGFQANPVHQTNHNVDHQLTGQNNRTGHDQYQANSVTQMVPQCGGANSMIYQCYRQRGQDQDQQQQQHHHHHQSHHQIHHRQQQQPQPRADLEEAIQYQYGADQTQYYDGEQNFNNERIEDRPHMIIQEPTVNNYDHVYRQVNRENYHTVCRGYQDELCLV